MRPALQAFLEGVRLEFPLLVGVFPFGLIYGALALDSGLSPAIAQSMSAVIFAGASQFIFAQLVQESAPGLIIALTVAVVNLRHVLYSASIAPYIEHLPMRWKTLLAYLLTDEAYAVAILHYRDGKVSPASHWLFFGAGISLWATWQASSAIGIFLGAAIPASWPLDFAIPLTFLAMVVPALKNTPAIASALSAGVVALLAYSLPFKLGLILAALTGIGVGTFLEVRE